jgi:hypothetical protein
MEDITELKWHKSSYSSNGGECVEVGTTANGQAAGIRDSKRPHDGHLVATAATFSALLASVKRGDLDLGRLHKEPGISELMPGSLM